VKRPGGQSQANIPATTQKSISLPERAYLKVSGTVLGLTAPRTLFYDLHFNLVAGTTHRLVASISAPNVTLRGEEKMRYVALVTLAAALMLPAAL
jgi:hypothetical protein